MPPCRDQSQGRVHLAARFLGDVASPSSPLYPLPKAAAVPPGAAPAPCCSLTSTLWFCGEHANPVAALEDSINTHKTDCRPPSHT